MQNNEGVHMTAPCSVASLAAGSEPPRLDHLRGHLAAGSGKVKFTGLTQTLGQF
jgi:hypothetical protein